MENRDSLDVRILTPSKVEPLSFLLGRESGNLTAQYRQYLIQLAYSHSRATITDFLAPVSQEKVSTLPRSTIFVDTCIISFLVDISLLQWSGFKDRKRLKP